MRAVRVCVYYVVSGSKVYYDMCLCIVILPMKRYKPLCSVIRYQHY